MDCVIDDVKLHYSEHGDGTPLVALHGAGVDHRELEAGLEAALTAGCRRIYPDLPGMGRSTSDGLMSHGDVVAVLAEFIDRVAGAPVLLFGHSYGAYLARVLAAERPDLVRGLALVCPFFADGTSKPPEQRALVDEPDAYDELETSDRAGFEGYFVIRTPATARRYRDAVAPGTTLVDPDALGRIFAQWSLPVESEPFPRPTLIVAGRRDSTAGYVDAVALLDSYPRATLAVLENAGHALIHEQPEQLSSLLRDWLERLLGTARMSTR